ncbi:hypothetical protein CP533_1405 [Ophiocordyceps camponoti-saundersi (nom. inval.)]|nr:hypothetical protein CP533_1405 [Ophiocordyceps camponoti-saundersi (nom. inval.)]
MTKMMRSATPWLAYGSRSQPLLMPVRPSPSTSRRRPVPSVSASTSSEAMTWPRGPNPSPYEVLGVSRSGPYSKTRFYQLVKLYHPDSNQPSSVLPPSVRLERYRLVVAANDLLSDPAKRRLYDALGIGWLPPSQSHSQPSANTHRRESDSSWRHRPGSAANNATWEDWEAWHEARRRRQQQHSSDPNPELSNVEIALVYLCLIVIPLYVHIFGIGPPSADRADRAQRQTSAIKEEVRRSTEATSERTMHESIDHFLMSRQADWRLPSIHSSAGRLPSTLDDDGPPYCHGDDLPVRPLAGVKAVLVEDFDERYHVENVDDKVCQLQHPPQPSVEAVPHGLVSAHRATTEEVTADANVLGVSVRAKRPAQLIDQEDEDGERVEDKKDNLIDVGTRKELEVKAVDTAHGGAVTARAGVAAAGTELLLLAKQLKGFVEVYGLAGGDDGQEVLCKEADKGVPIADSLAVEADLDEEHGQDAVLADVKGDGGIDDDFGPEGTALGADDDGEDGGDLDGEDEPALGFLELDERRCEGDAGP